MILIDFTFDKIAPMPAARTRSTKLGHHFTPAKYRKYKTTLSTAIAVQYPELVATVPCAGTTERAKFLRDNKYCLLLKIYRAENRGDKDNYEKSVMDALGDAGVFANDSQVVCGFSAMFIDKAHPRVEFQLVRLPVFYEKTQADLVEYLKNYLSD